ncbi:hypothetical protein WR25_00873 [Diploscapter pachys]|uniref:Uncharacterized protein n=1 Tax=Diploscapter pachys TaxID=2018661 RepID=A0A2A2KIN5_9BILA|nr:hypothetical protein WR25_00873 [Diploscapter pachys]
MAQRQLAVIGESCGGGGGDDPVGGGDEFHCRAIERVRRHRPPADRPLPLSRRVGGDEAIEQVARTGERQRLAGIRPILQPDEGARRLAVGRHPAERLIFRDRARRVEPPESRLQHLHRQHAQRLRGRQRRLPQVAHPATRRAIAIEAPRRRDRGEAPHGRIRRRRGRHRAAQAVSDQHRRRIELLDQRQQQRFDMAGHVHVPVRRRRHAPVDQRDAKALCRQPAHQRYFAQIENCGRIDQGRHAHHHPPAPAIITQRRPSRGRERRHGRRSCGPGRPLIGGQPGERGGHPLGICCGFAAQHVEEQGQRPRTVLRCGKLRRSMRFDHGHNTGTGRGRV